jgi:predicted AAA+ superfamily ATPase
MNRKIDDYFLTWKSSRNRKPLMVRGARQVGKTYSIEKFAGQNYRYLLKVNLEQDRNIHSVFESLRPEQIVNELSVLYQIPVEDEHTLLFIDEIQACPRAIAALRYFYEQKPGLHIICAGSLLDHTLNELQYSMPVGRLDYAYMYPLSFSEFLKEAGENGLYGFINGFTVDGDFSLAIHNRILELLRLYFFIGGMPEAVDYYLKTRDLSGIDKIHSALITSIEYDFSKYGTRKQQELLRDVLHYVANNIGKKVKYVNVNRNVPSALLKDALLKLEMSRIIHLVRHTRSSEVPLSRLQDNDVFKPLLFDIGILGHIAGIKLLDIKNLATEFDGAMAEQFVFQELLASGQPYREQRLSYWIREAKNSNAEIDCLHQVGNRVYPVEIKSGKRGTLKSLHVFLAEKNKSTGIRLNADSPSVGNDLTARVNLPGKEELTYNLISLPLYLAGRLDQIVT